MFIPDSRVVISLVPYYFAIGMEVQMLIQMIECYYLSFHFVLTQTKLVQKMSYIFRCPKNEENSNFPILKICVKKNQFSQKSFVKLTILPQILKSRRFEFS